MPSFFFQDDFSCFYILIMRTIYSLLHSNLLVLNFPKFKMMKIGDQKKLFSLEMHIFFSTTIFKCWFKLLYSTFFFFFLQIQILAILLICLWKICQIGKVSFCERGIVHHFSLHYNFYGNNILIHLIQILLFNNAWNSW